MKSHDRRDEGRGEPSQPASSLCLLTTCSPLAFRSGLHSSAHSSLLSFKETCSLSKKKKTKREELSEKRIQEEYEKLGAIT